MTEFVWAKAKKHEKHLKFTWQTTKQEHIKLLLTVISDLPVHSYQNVQICAVWPEPYTFVIHKVE